jgi:hypothetical protein
MIINFLNHASVLIQIDQIKLLTDPWFEGYCFNGGWGLRYNNEVAWEKAAGATHLWVSHYHGDHFHPPTLKKILAINPDIIAIGNHSYNFQMDESLRSLGFRNVIPFKERKSILLNSDTEVIRYPTTGIDNMLVVRSKSATILNYNDCSLPPRSRKMLSRKIGKIDLFLSNFNHAGKLLLYPYPPDEEIKKSLLEAYAENLSIFDAAYFMPFASYHYYRAPESMNQNNSLLDGQDLKKAGNKNVIAARIGDEITIERGESGVVCRFETVGPPPVQNNFTKLERHGRVELHTIIESARKYCKRIRSHYFFTARFMPRLSIKIADLGKLVILDPRKGMYEAKENSEPHIISHSEPLNGWFNDRFGTDSFIVGAHFEINNRNRIPLKWQIILGLLIDNKLDLKSVLKMLVSRKGIRFLFNRREEIWGIMFSGRIHAEYQDQ